MSWSLTATPFVTLYTLGRYRSWTIEATISHQLSYIMRFNTIQSRLRCDPGVVVAVAGVHWLDWGWTCTYTFWLCGIESKSLAVLLWCLHIFSLSFTICSRTTRLWGLQIGILVGSNALYFHPFNSYSCERWQTMYKSTLNWTFSPRKAVSTTHRDATLLQR